MNSYRKYGFHVAYGEKLIIVFCSSLPLFSLTSPSSVSHHPCKKFQHPAVYKSQVSHVWRHGASGFCLISCPGTVLLPTPPSRGGLQRTWSAGSTGGFARRWHLEQLLRLTAETASPSATKAPAWKGGGHHLAHRGIVPHIHKGRTA